MPVPLLRTADPAEVELMLDWAAAEGWNPGIDDAAAFHAADPDGFFLAEVEGTPVAAISVVNHDIDFAFLGLYICAPAHRGQGIGSALWAHALAHAGGRGIGLDAVAAQQGTYASLGFEVQGATTRWAGRLAPATAAGLRPVTAADIPALVALDADAGGLARPAFLHAWAKGAPTRGSVMRDDGTGFATARRCRDGAVKIGPVVAPDAAGALQLAEAALALVPGEAVLLDLPGSSADLAAALVARGFAPVFETARMHLGGPPPYGAQMQAIATMELG